MLDGKNDKGILVSDGNGNVMGMGINSLKWDGFGTINLFPHISNSNLVLFSLHVPLRWLSFLFFRQIKKSWGYRTPTRHAQ